MFTKRRALAGILAAGLLVGGCSRPKDEGPAQPQDAGPDAEPLSPTSPTASAAALPAPSPAEAAGAPDTLKTPKTKDEEPPTPPQGYVLMRVMDIVPTSQGNAVLLTDQAEERMLPIFVGGTEALSIQLRLGEKRYERPLTHDLLDNLVGKLGGDLVKVHVDEIRGSVFVGSVHIRQAGKIFSVDARPSDAIALALGRRAPIFVASKVVDQSSIKKRDLLREPDDPERFHIPPTQQNPLHL